MKKLQNMKRCEYKEEVRKHEELRCSTPTQLKTLSTQEEGVYQINAVARSMQGRNGQSSGEGERKKETAGVGTAGVSRGLTAEATVRRDTKIVEREKASGKKGDGPAWARPE